MRAQGILPLTLRGIRPRSLTLLNKGVQLAGSVEYVQNMPNKNQIVFQRSFMS